MLIKKKKFYISTSIVYSSSIPHIGNIYEMILADVITRFKRLKGYDVYFQTGTDEHGQKIEQKAKKEGFSSQKYVNNVSDKIKKIYDLMNIKYDYFIRTTHALHKKNVQYILEKLIEKKDVYLGKYEGWYSVSEESFVSEKDLINGKTINGEKPIWSSEEVYFLKLHRYQKKLLNYLQSEKNLILPKQRKKEIFNLLEEPLSDLSITRTSFKWGIPLTLDSKHIVYVWIDALSNYITGFNCLMQDNCIFTKNKKFNYYWPCDLHVIGKDISRFHLIYWPILLMALELPLPKQFLIHPWILFNNKKMSKSTNNVLYVEDLLKFFPVDAIRYFVLSEIPYVSDGIITFNLLFEKYNTDLVNTLGNLLNRTLGMIEKYKNNQLKKVVMTNFSQNNEINLSKVSLETVRLVFGYMKLYKISDALKQIIKLARLCNKYIDIIKPWDLFKNYLDHDKIDLCLYNLVETIRFIGILLKPFLPNTSYNILDQIKAEQTTFESLKEFGITQNKKLFLGNILFKRLEKNKI
ncbi:methionine--tRNA ligase [Candidatus Phytoplasma oryzae]|uniref:Methionine--tRNA ligase n=1 Tax=Candidatus Phytoplasma oryzae TaxID=203274 RepID=A0A139JQ88_9MOLU|nr:methionine--tRNA ligase [Candidatus Phytoplasma oryzae]KXT29141.1 methionine--tRNA ligase [Candidatus Phytoplasma oryzae]RAM57753.1 methionyl-tRNA synthetase [Candidatus Phytoplasma oryzae]